MSIEFKIVKFSALPSTLLSFSELTLVTHHSLLFTQMNDLELLSTYQTEFEAELVRNKLLAQGIEAMLEAQELSNAIPSLDYASGYHIYVEPEDLIRAQSIIEEDEGDLMDDDFMDDMEEV